jgi:hypothetical protein
MQPVGPVVVFRVEHVRWTDDPHVGIHGRLEQLAGLRVVRVKPARLLGENEPPLGLDAGPDLLDARAVGDLAAHLGLRDDFDDDLLGLIALGQVRLEERPAGRDLVVDARLPLRFGGKPGVGQDAKRFPGGDHDGLAEVHHFAPRFRPLAFLAAPRRLPRFVVPDVAPGDFPFSGFLRFRLRLFAPYRGYFHAALIAAAATLLAAAGFLSLHPLDRRAGHTPLGLAQFRLARHAHL